MRLNKYLIIFVGLLIPLSCVKEEQPIGDFIYSGPNPPIVKGSTPAQGLCFELYEKYDFHIYYTLSGDEALNTPLGMTTDYYIIMANPLAIPIQPADVSAAYDFLKILKNTYSLFSDEIVKSSMYKRHILVKVNPADNSMYDSEGNLFYNNGHTDMNNNGTVYFGEIDDSIINPNYKGWCHTILYNLLLGITKPYFDSYIQLYNTNKIQIPLEFEDISKGFYMYDSGLNRNLYFDSYGKFIIDKAYEYGFVHPTAVETYSFDFIVDFVRVAEWLITKPKGVITEVLNNPKNLRLKKKCEIVQDFYKKNFDLDLSTLNTKVNNLSFN